MESSLPQLILPIKMERSSERLTSIGGLVVLEEMAQALGVWKKVDEHLEGPGSGRGYRPSEFVQPLVWMLHAGGRRLEDLRELRAEQEVLEELGLRTLPDAGTVGDWLCRQGARGVEGLERVNRELIQGPLEQEGEELILDVDATEIEAEKQEAKWTYHHVQGYMPRVGYVNSLCVGQEFREGNVSPWAGILYFAQKCEAALPEGKRIYFRSDSAGYQAERYCYHAVACNREEGAREVIWKHNGRGNSENWHKELKVGVGMEQMPCRQFQANALYFAIGVLAYNLAQLLKRQVLPEPYRTATLATLRWHLGRWIACAGCVNLIVANWAGESGSRQRSTFGGKPSVRDAEHP